MAQSAADLARLKLPIDVAQYDFQDAAGTVRGLPHRWRWITEGLDELPGGSLVALDAIADVLRSAGSEGDHLAPLSDGVQAQLGLLALEHGDRARLVDVLGEHHPLTIATEECDRLLSVVGRAVAAEGAPGVEHGAVGRLEQIHTSGGGAPKATVSSAEVGVRGLAGDTQTERAHHGRPFQAVSLYSHEVIESLQREGHPIEPGSTGENLTISGLEWATLRPGLRLAFGDVGDDANTAPVVLEITSWAPPCKNIAPSFADRRFDRIDHDKHPGWSRAYAGVVQTGSLSPGAPVTLLP